MNVSRTTPVSVASGSAEKLSEFTNFINFLKVMENHSLLDESTHSGKVILADGVHLNQHVMRRSFQDLGIGEKLITMNDG